MLSFPSPSFCCCPEPDGDDDGAREEAETEVLATTRPSMVTRFGQWSQLTIPVSLRMPSDVHAATSGTEEAEPAYRAPG